MKRFVKKMLTLSAVVGAAAGSAIMPAASAHADAQLPCYRIAAVCAWSEPGGQGELRLLFGPEFILDPPVQSAQNQTQEPWCFYREPGFRGDERRQVQPNETAYDFGFQAYSAKPGPCWN